MQKHVLSVIQALSKKEFQLENIRQLLCEELEFTPVAAYQFIVHGHYSQQIDLYSLLNLLGEDSNTSALQSVLKYYSNNELCLQLEHFEAMVVTREDKLVRKLIKQREPDLDHPLPDYLVNYLKKLWLLEGQLHAQLNKLKAKSRPQLLNHLEIYKVGDFLNEQAFRQAYTSQTDHACQECPAICFEVALRYMRGSNSAIPFDRIVSLMVPQNCNTIKEFLNAQEQAFNKITSKHKNRDPYLHKQFSNLKKESEDYHFCFREIKSVETHIERGKKVPTNTKIKQKIIEFSKGLAESLSRYFCFLKKMIKETRKILSNKVDLLESCQCNFRALFREITPSQYLVPSELQHYLSSAGINLQLYQLFIIFKKHGDPLTGKLNLARFTNLFLPQNLDSQLLRKKNSKIIEPSFRRAAIACLLDQIKCELKIESLKQRLTESINLRQVYDGLDADKSGKISRTDLQIVYRKVIGTVLGDQDLQVLWNRMGKSLNEYVNYDTFMFEMLPKLRKRPRQQKTHTSIRH